MMELKRSEQSVQTRKQRDQQYHERSDNKQNRLHLLHDLTISSPSLMTVASQAPLQAMANRTLSWISRGAKLGTSRLASRCASLSCALVLTIGSAPAIAQRVTSFDLDQAICANDWPTAISLVTVIMAQEETTSAERNALLSLRRQLERYRNENVIVTDEIACDRADSYYLQSTLPSTVQTGEPLGWENAVAEVTENRFSTELVTEPVDFTLPVEIGVSPGLTPATPVDLSQGLSVVSGHVGQGHEVYGFVAKLGDRLEANLEVTRVMTGSLYTSDDSQLFLFDRYGNLIASADDTHGTEQSHLTDVIIPKTDLYFAVVTTYNNDPILNPEGRLAGWQDNGGGRFDYTLTISGVTPTSAIVR